MTVGAAGESKTNPIVAMQVAAFLRQTAPQGQPEADPSGESGFRTVSGFSPAQPCYTWPGGGLMNHRSIGLQLRSVYFTLALSYIAHS